MSNTETCTHCGGSTEIGFVELAGGAYCADCAGCCDACGEAMTNEYLTDFLGCYWCEACGEDVYGTCGACLEHGTGPDEWLHTVDDLRWDDDAAAPADYCPEHWADRLAEEVADLTGDARTAATALMAGWRGTPAELRLAAEAVGVPVLA